MADELRDASRRGARLLATAAGQALGAVFFSAGKVRVGRRKALHPRGAMYAARLERRGGPERAGVDWLDSQGTEDVVVRLSRATGLPPFLPDILGLAMRVLLHDGSSGGDLLLATTGTGSLSRFVLRPSRHPMQVDYTTLLPYASSGGPIQIVASPKVPDAGTDPQHGSLDFDLAWSRGTGAWNGFATLTLLEPRGLDADGGAPVAFDPVLHPLPGLSPYPLVARLRAPAYAASRRARN